MTYTEKDTIGTAKQLTISNHVQTQFEAMIFQGLTQGGIQATASKGHGKTRFLFTIAGNLMLNEKVRVIAFDGSLAWLYGFSAIPVFNIGEHDILSNSRNTTEDLEKYSLENWNLVKLALDTRKDMLFNLKTRKPSKRGFFIRTVIGYLDSLQRLEKAKTATHENSKAIAYILEEAQDAFNSRSTAKNESEEFLTIFNEARNNKESFFSCSQRLTDMSKTIRAKQLQCLGKLSSEDITPNLRRIEKQHKIDFANMPSRNWFFEGSLIVSPEFKQQGKPYKINADIKQEWLASLPKEKVLTLKEKIKLWFSPQTVRKTKISKRMNLENNSNSLFEKEEIEEESEDNSDLEEIEEEWIE